MPYIDVSKNDEVKRLKHKYRRIYYKTKNVRKKTNVWDEKKRMLLMELNVKLYYDIFFDTRRYHKKKKKCIL